MNIDSQCSLTHSQRHVCDLHVLVQIESSCGKIVTCTTGSSASAQARGRNSANFKRGVAAVLSRTNSCNGFAAQKKLAQFFTFSFRYFNYAKNHVHPKLTEGACQQVTSSHHSHPQQQEQLLLLQDCIFADIDA
jgi:hypothetical protein